MVIYGEERLYLGHFVRQTETRYSNLPNMLNYDMDVESGRCLPG